MTKSFRQNLTKFSLIQPEPCSPHFTTSKTDAVQSTVRKLVGVIKPTMLAMQPMDLFRRNRGKNLAFGGPRPPAQVKVANPMKFLSASRLF